MKGRPVREQIKIRNKEAADIEKDILRGRVSFFALIHGGFCANGGRVWGEKFLKEKERKP